MPVSASSRLVVTFHYAVLCLASLVVIGPVLWALSTSLKPSAEVLSFPPTWLPRARHSRTMRASSGLGS